MKRLLTILLCSNNIIFGQNIVPGVTTEFCPDQNVVFTVTLNGIGVSGVVGTANFVSPVVVQPPYDISSSGSIITFKFVGKFIDQNTRQTFTVNYTNNSGIGDNYQFVFTRIRSLHTPTSYSEIFPSPSTFIALCAKILPEQ